MGLKCDIKKEICGGICTGWDGIISEKVIIPANTNAWDGLKLYAEHIPCEECKPKGIKKLSAIQDQTNLSIGERAKPFDHDNFRDFTKDIVCTWNKCVERGDCKGEIF